MTPNNSRGCVKSGGVKFGNDQFLGMGNFDEMSWRIQWSEIEFSHSLSPEPIDAVSPHSRLIGMAARPLEFSLYDFVLGKLLW